MAARELEQAVREGRAVSRQRKIRILNWAGYPPLEHLNFDHMKVLSVSKKFWKKFRSPNVGKDILYAVRPHRFGFAPQMALASRYDSRWGEVLNEILESWTQLHPDRSNLPYVSNLVAIQRVLSLSWAWAFLAAQPIDEVRDGFYSEVTILKIIRQDARYLGPRLGHSVPNNHLLVDWFAGWYISTLFSELISDLEWPKHCEEQWLNELRRQTYEDGSGFEHSAHYHEYACEMAVAYVLLSRRNGRDVPEWVLNRLERMLAFQVDLCGPETTPLPVGNATEDPLFPLDAGGGWASGALRELYRALFQSELHPAPETELSIERAFWLLGGKLAPFPTATTERGGFRKYPKGGFFILADEDPGTRLTFRSGPPPDVHVIGGHMHADLLSVYLNIRGVPMLVDAGTYTYRANPKAWFRKTPRWRQYFAGPEAHNGLSIGSEDPLGPMKGDFRGRDVQTRVATNFKRIGESITWLEGEIRSDNAYAGYRRGIVHILGEYWVVYDHLAEGTPLERCSFRFQLAAGVAIRKLGQGAAYLQSGDAGLNIDSSAGLLGPEVVEGRTRPLGGWVSPRYGELVPAAQIIFRHKGTTPITAFLLRPGAVEISSICLESALSGCGAIGIRVTSADFEDYLLLRLDGRKAPFEIWEMEVDGSFFWFRTEKNKPTALRWFDGQRLRSQRFGVEVRTESHVNNLEIHADEDDVYVYHYPRDELIMQWPDGANST